MNMGAVLAFTLLLPALAAAEPVPATCAVPGAGQAAAAAPEVKSGGDGKVSQKDPQACKDGADQKKVQLRKQSKAKKTGAPFSRNKHAPEWTIKGRAAFKDSGILAFYGVGSAPAAIRDEYLRRETADNRARADIQNGFSTATESTGTTTITADGGKKTERAVTTVKSGDISMARIIDRYQAADGTIYSLAKTEIDRQGQVP
jgi:hypothetical protein